MSLRRCNWRRSWGEATPLPPSRLTRGSSISPATCIRPEWGGLQKIGLGLKTGHYKVEEGKDAGWKPALRNGRSSAAPLQRKGRQAGMPVAQRRARYIVPLQGKEKHTQSGDAKWPLRRDAALKSGAT